MTRLIQTSIYICTKKNRHSLLRTDLERKDRLEESSVKPMAFKYFNYLQTCMKLTFIKLFIKEHQKSQKRDKGSPISSQFKYDLNFI